MPKDFKDKFTSTVYTSVPTDCDETIQLRILEGIIES